MSDQRLTELLHDVQASTPYTAVDAHNDGAHSTDPWFREVCVKCAVQSVPLHYLTLAELRKLCRKFGGPTGAMRTESFGWLNQFTD